MGSAFWRLSDEAFVNGVQSTSKFRKASETIKAPKSRTSKTKKKNPAKQAAGSLGGRSKRRNPRGPESSPGDEDSSFDQDYIPSSYVSSNTPFQIASSINSPLPNVSHPHMPLPEFANQHPQLPQTPQSMSWSRHSSPLMHDWGSPPPSPAPGTRMRTYSPYPYYCQPLQPSPLSRYQFSSNSGSSQDLQLGFTSVPTLTGYMPQAMGTANSMPTWDSGMAYNVSISYSVRPNQANVQIAI